MGCAKEASGALAEYCVVPETNVVLMPESLSFIDAASLPVATITVLQALSKGFKEEKVKLPKEEPKEISETTKDTKTPETAETPEGEDPEEEKDEEPNKKETSESIGLKEPRILIVASVSVGNAAVQIAKNLYKAHVVALCRKDRMEFVKGLGADEVYENCENLESIKGEFDVILDTVQSDAKRFEKYLKKGRFVTTTYQTGIVAKVRTMMRRNYISCVVKDREEDLKEMVRMITTGELKPFVEKVFPLEESIEAFQSSTENVANGKMVISVTGVKGTSPQSL